MTFEDVLKLAWKGFTLVIAAGGGGALVAWGLFKWLGSHWMEQKFKTQLENLKHEQNKEIEALRHKIQSLYSRISKIHEKEFEVLPKAWFLLHEAQGKSFHAMKVLKEIPDFLTMPEERLQEFLKGSRLAQFQQKALLVLPHTERTAYWSNEMFWIELNDAEAAHAEFHNYLIENRIFMTEELRDKFAAVDHDLADALSSQRLWKMYGEPKLRDEVGDKLSKLPDKIVAIESAVQKRLHYQDA